MAVIIILPLFAALLQTAQNDSQAQVVLYDYRLRRFILFENCTSSGVLLKLCRGNPRVFKLISMCSIPTCIHITKPPSVIIQHVFRDRIDAFGEVVTQAKCYKNESTPSRSLYSFSCFFTCLQLQQTRLQWYSFGPHLSTSCSSLPEPSSTSR